MTDFLIRRASPSDARFIAWTILTATRSHLSKGWFDIALNQPEDFCVKFLEQLTTAKTRSQWHYSRFTIVEVAFRPVAALCTVRAADTYAMAPLAILESQKNLGVPQKERSAFWKRGAYIFSCTIRPDDESLVMEVAATVQEHRGRGYVATLFERAFSEARAAGLKKAEGTCFIGNKASQRLYEQTGFALIEERHDAQFEAVSGDRGIRRYARTL